MKKLGIPILVVIVVVALFSACSPAKESSTADESLQYVLDNGKLVMGLDDSFPPMGFRDEGNNIVGYDVDLAMAVAEKLGVELVLQPIAWSSKELELDGMNIDCIWNGMSIDKARQAAMAMTEPYLANEMVFITNSGSDITSLAGLAGKKIGVQTGSTAEGALENAVGIKSVVEVFGFDSNLTAFLDLETGGIDAVLIDSVVARYAITENGSDFVVIDEAVSEEFYGVGFRKADVALRDKVWATLNELTAEGVVAEISKKWFSEDVSLIGK